MGPSVAGGDNRRLRRWLDDVLDTLSDEHRAVLVLVDLEEQTMTDASSVLDMCTPIPEAAPAKCSTADGQTVTLALRSTCTTALDIFWVD